MQTKNFRIITPFLVIFFAIACGNRFDLATESGKQARIDEANAHLSNGKCQEALDAITPLFDLDNSVEEVRIIKAGAFACFAGYSVLNILGNVADKANNLSGLALSMPNNLNDGKIERLYEAMDLLTENNTKLNASQRTSETNSFMVFLQFGIIGAIMNAYGDPDSEGDQTTDLIYDLTADPAREMSTVDACALSAALSIAVDSFNISGINGNNDSTSALDSLNDVCAEIPTVSSCNELNKDRTSCTGQLLDTPSVLAAATVTALNSEW